MRDIDRIDRICGKLNKLWHEYPDQRLGQLIVNYAMDEENVFFQDDDITESNLDSILKEHRDKYIDFLVSRVKR